MGRPFCPAVHPHSRAKSQHVTPLQAQVPTSGACCRQRPGCHPVKNGTRGYGEESCDLADQQETIWVAYQGIGGLAPRRASFVSRAEAETVRRWEWAVARSLPMQAIVSLHAHAAPSVTVSWSG